MIVFEDQLARIVEILPEATVGATSKVISFNWGTETILANYLTLSGNNNFPLIWLAEGEDNNSLREPSVTRNARIVILHESQAPEKFNDYQHEYDYNIILQPIADNLIKALSKSGISRIDDTKIRSQRVKNYSTRNEGESLVYICNAIVLDIEVTFSGISSCIKTNIF